MFKNIAILATALLASTATATVVLSAGTECGTVTTTTVATEGGVCYSTSSTEWHSAKGCASNHVLRLHHTEDCTDNLDSLSNNDLCDGDCTNLNGESIGSFKCVVNDACNLVSSS